MKMTMVSSGLKGLICLADQITDIDMNKLVFKHADLQIYSFKLKKNMGIFHPLEDMCRGNEPQLKVGEHFKYLI